MEHCTEEMIFRNWHAQLIMLRRSSIFTVISNMMIASQHLIILVGWILKERAFLMQQLIKESEKTLMKKGVRPAHKPQQIGNTF